MADNLRLKTMAWAVPTAATITIFSSFLMTEPQILPSENFVLPNACIAQYEWEQRSSRNPNIMKLTENETIEKTQIVYEFASKIIDESVELDPRFAKIVSDNLWDLV